MIQNVLRNAVGKGIHVMAAKLSTDAMQRFSDIKGWESRGNDVIYCPSKNRPPFETVIFFSGDIQDYSENMLSHRDNKHHVRWNLESTATLLQQRFPDAVIFIVKPSKMALGTFSCYQNFVDVNNFGVPTYKASVEGLKHLQHLLLNAFKRVREIEKPSEISDENEAYSKSLRLVGFSKGCVVLNQMLYSFKALSDNPDNDLSEFVKAIKVMYWLEGGHSGSSGTWVTDKAVLESFSQRAINVIIHVTPYQVMCDTRPRIGREEKLFRETLRRFGVNVERTLHFENEPRSLENHFQVLEKF